MQRRPQSLAATGLRMPASSAVDAASEILATTSRLQALLPKQLRLLNFNPSTKRNRSLSSC
eukprot:8206146-Alexandrium_andersonii.AAC.1